MKNRVSADLIISFSCLPARKITNLDLAKKFLSENKDAHQSASDLASSIEKHTGIQARRYANETDAASDLPTKVLLPLIQGNVLEKEGIGAILTATTSGDFPSPATANWIHKALALQQNIHCLDVASSCSSFLSALRCAFGFLSTGANTLVVATEVKHKSLSHEDLRSLSLFGDGSAGLYLQSTQTPNSEFIFAHNEISSELSENICIPVGGSREPVTKENIHRNKLQFIDPKGMYIRTVKSIVFAIEQLWKEKEKEFPDAQLDLVFIHQANKNIITDVQNRLPKEISDKIPILMSDVGNMVCASLPVLRSRVLFLRALFYENKNQIQKNEILTTFISICNKNNQFSYQYVSNGILFKALWKRECIFIFDDGCDSLEDSWLTHICENELENVMRIFSIGMQEGKTETCEFWVAAGGGFQTIGLIHRHRPTILAQLNKDKGAMQINASP